VTVYSALKFLRFPEQLRALAEGRVVAPVHVRIKPTNLCNHACWYCAYRADGLQLGESMREHDTIPATKMEEIADDLAALGVKAVTFSGGGEPLLYKPLPEIVERLAARGLRVATLTNGSNLKGRVAAALASCATWVRVSVDAWDEASYVASRGAKAGQFQELLSNMAAFVRTGTRCVLGVSFVITEENHAHVAEACRLFREAGTQHVKISGAVVSNDGAENNRYHARFSGRAREGIAAATALAGPGFSVIDHYHPLDESFAKSYRSCPFLQFLTVIGADLNVYTCQDKAYTAAGLLGSIRERSFRDLWLSEENRLALRSLDPSLRCNHHCVAHQKNLAILEYLSLDGEHGLFV
jgi:MoaA/NifB/PqqE/SkfB family radical SAM enzyme